MRVLPCLVVVLPLAMAARGETVRPDVSQLLERDGRVSVVVLIREEPVSSLVEESLSERCARHARSQERLLADLGEILAGSECRLRHRFRFSPAVLLEIRSLDALAAVEACDGVASVSPDLAGHGALDDSRQMIGADQVHEVDGFRGEGRIVAVLDTGVDATHPDLAGAVVHEWHFLDKGDRVGGGAMDDNGHGTHIAGILASRGVTTPLGIAPAAKLIIVKVLDWQNRGWVSDWTRGVEHLISLHEADNGIRVDAINMSMVTDVPFESDCDSEPSLEPFRRACEVALARGLALFAASGNGGSLTSMGSPACFSVVTSVGSVRDRLPDEISPFTNRNGLLDLLAPGEAITSCRVGGGSGTFQGTSQAVPHVAAVACLLRELNPDLTPGRVVEILQTTGLSVDDRATGLAFPRVDARAAVASLMPAITGLICEYDAVADQIRARWDPDTTFETVAVTRAVSGETPIERVTQEGGIDFPAPAPGIHEICARPVVERGRGKTRCCQVIVPDRLLFSRGDCNADDELNISDAVKTLLHLFHGGTTEPPCLRACDANDDGDVNISDAIHLLSALFQGGALPTAPYPLCGLDPTPDTIACVNPACHPDPQSP